MMEATRIDTKELSAAIQEALSYIALAMGRLAPYVSIITPEDRKAALKPGEGFPAAAKALCRASRDHAVVSSAAGFTAEAVEEDLANLETLVPLIEKLTEFSQQLSDSKLVWLAEAYGPCLALYSAAKAMSKQNGALRTLVTPMAQIFSSPRAREEQPTPSTEG